MTGRERIPTNLRGGVPDRAPFGPNLWPRLLFVLGAGLLIYGMPLAARASSGEQWRPLELAFTAERQAADPFDIVRCRFVAEFSGPNGARLTVPGFWDGGKTWKVRFTPTAPGRWSYATVFADKDDRGLHAQQGRIDVAPPTGATDIRRHGGMLRVSTSGRYLTYSDGTPFFWLGDTWWAVPSFRVPFEDFRRQVDRRIAQKYTVYQAHGHQPIFRDEKGNGIGAFEATRQPSPEVLAYWREVDRYVAYGDEHGLVGVVGFAAHSLLDSMPLTELQRLWHYYIARFGAYAITFLITQEYNARLGSADERVPKLLVLGRFIKETDPYRRAMTVHPWTHAGDRREAWSTSWLDFAMFQAGHWRFAPAEFYWGVFHATPRRPLVEAEANYEAFTNSRLTIDAAAVRRAAYTAIQGGSCGFTYGAQGLYAGVTDRSQPYTTAQWGPVLTSEEGLQLPGGAQMQHLRAAFESVAWWKLEPALGIVDPPGDVLVKADGIDSLVLYFPPNAMVAPGARLTHMRDGNSYTAEWFNPRTGERTNLEPGLVVQRDRLPLPPRPNEEDWVLILRRKSV